jgi:cytosine permease
MSESKTVQQLVEDHALDPVPDGERHSWLDISWSTVGIVTTLIQLYVGAMLAFVAGMKIALLAGATVMVIGGLMGWGTGHIAFKSGLTSAMMSRLYGFGIKGSLITSSIFGFMLIGFIALENVLLYNGFLFYFNAQDTLGNRVIAYSVLTLTWIMLTAYGFKAVTRVSSFMLVGFLAVLGYMMVVIIGSSDQSIAEIASFGSQLPSADLRLMGIDDELGKFVFCINVLAGAAGALALVDADLGRYARTSLDIGIAAVLGNFALDILMVFIGAAIMFAGMPALIDYYVSVGGLTEAEASRVAIENPDRIAYAFIVFGGVVGALLMVAAQTKAQVLNTYSSSLSLANFCDAVFSWRPGRFTFVVAANVLSVLFLYGDFLTWFDSFLIILGVLTTCFAGIMMADYFIVRPRLGHQDISRFGAETVNWAGVVSLALAFVLAHYVLAALVPIEIFTAIGVSFLVYPLLRLYVLKPGY